MTSTVGQRLPVFVVIPTYNRAAILGRAISSCQRQSYPVDEVIVVDDASSDGTQACKYEREVGATIIAGKAK
jgi:glycosyltransferase involved in cell wall biosynthesis